MTLTTLVIGARASAREAAIARMVDPSVPTALILEGLADGGGILESLVSPKVHLVRIAPGCPCCIGNLTMRVHLNRILRHPPAQLYLSLANSAHMDKVRDFLTQVPYDTLLTLTDVIDCDAAA